MPPPKGPLWDYFLPGAKQNASHLRAHCHGCLEKQRPETTPIELDDDGNPKMILATDAWVISACAADVGGVLGVKDSMIAHLLGKGGSGKCPNASSKARRVARDMKAGASEKKNGGKRERDSSTERDSEMELSEKHNGRKTKRKLLTKVKKSMQQQELKVFRGIEVPFTKEQESVVHRQFLRATISANLPFRWVENPEVMKLFLLFRATAGDVLPSRKQVAGPLLDAEDQQVKHRLQIRVKGKYAVIASDGWKDVSRDSVTGVSLSVDGESHLIELILATAHQKDGDAMCKAFKGMIDRAEKEYAVLIVLMCSDNDGGSQWGRKLLVLARPWLFEAACCAHQFQLMLGEYFKVNNKAAETAEEATDLIGWILNHQRVRSIFNDMQAEISDPPGKVLALLVANLTRWTTHLIAFSRLLKLKDALRRAVISKRQEIINAQVGAEKNRQKRTKLEDDAVAHCDLIDSGDFWRKLKTVCEDLEPICLGLNMNQTNSMRADQAVLSFAGVFLHFQKHSNRAVGTAMMKKIEKRWKALDQPMFILALVLNPFEVMSRFGDKASVSQFTLNTVLLQVYRRVRSRPPQTPRSESEEAEHQRVQLEKEKAVSEAFLSYLSSKGVFKDWASNKDAFQRVNGDDPIRVWKAFLATPSVAELADFAILLFSIIVNQAGLERNFSDLKIKKSCIRNRIRIPRLEKMAKLGADIRSSQADSGFLDERDKRKNHDSARVGELLVVPRYAEPVSGVGEDSGTEDGEQSPRAILVRSRKGWRNEMAKWIQSEQEKDDGHSEELANAVYGQRRSTWLPRSLELLFGGQQSNDIARQMERVRRQQAHTEEGRLMELLVDELEGEEILDDGELAGSGDDFDG